MTSNDPKRIVVFGRTGAGKSSLGNQIFGAEQFKEGHTLNSETTSCQEKVFKWPKHPSPTVSYIDTPGFADNRPEISNGHIINSIFELLKNLKGGINVALFCLAAKSRLDAFDMDEIKMLQTILGEGIYEHLWIVITRMDTFEEETREKYYKQIPEELPLLLKAHGIPLTQERILFSDFSEFDTGFLNPVTKILMETPLYKPLNSLKLEQAADDENKFLYSSAMKTILEKYKGLFADNEKQLAQNVADLKKRGSTTAFIKKQLERKEQEIQQLQEKIQNLDQITDKVMNKNEAAKEDYHFEANTQIQEERENIQKNWAWSPKTTLKISSAQQGTVEIQNLSKAFTEIHLDHLLRNGNWSWKVTITHQEGFFTKVKNFLFQTNHPTLGFKDELSTLYEMTYRGEVKQSLQHTSQYKSLSKTLNGADTIELLCDLNFSAKTFQVSYQGKVIVHNLKLRNGIQIRPFIGLCKGDTAFIELIEY